MAKAWEVLDTRSPILGNMAIVGAPYDDAKGDASGSAYIFAFDGTNWTQQAKLTGSDEVAFNNFGTGVAISGNMALVGTPGDGPSNQYLGAVYVFTFDGTAWTQKAKLLASVRDFNAEFGLCISLSGNTALIGGTKAAYIFTFNGTVWTQQAKLTSSDIQDTDYFGTAVSLSGQRALIGAYSAEFQGAAYVFDFDGTSWSQEAKLVSLDIAGNDNFGKAVWLAGDLAIVGAPLKDHNKGAAYIFSSDGTTWSQTTKLTALGARKADFFGTSVALPGTVALVGSQVSGGVPGVIYEYVLRRNVWTLGSQFLASGGMNGDNLGVSLAFSGATLLAGADAASIGGIGQAYIFSLARQH
ncbi:MAG: hypothetical protein H0X40_15140 [Chthoniobacterales bacterium]|nr:hypothetical protein [Chthoniobacterales bacterium]